MAIYKIFPSKDATLYSRNKTTNTGLDEILEIGAYTNTQGVANTPLALQNLGVDDLRRTVIQFDTKDINALVSTISLPGSSTYSASLKLFVASADNLNADYQIDCYPVSTEWQNGTGKYVDLPANTLGVSWVSRGVYQPTSGTYQPINWNIQNAVSTGSYYLTYGGGTWNNGLSVYQTFSFIENKDINMPVSDIVKWWMQGNLNNGFILKLTSSIENNQYSYTGLKYYSMDTHTIYPPCLEFKWDDSTFNTGSTPYTVVTDNQFTLVSNNNLGEYKQDSVYSFRFTARDQFPKRQFTTSSVYLNWKYLPSESYWAIQDYKTKELAIDFDQLGTKLSVDASGSFFNCYMNGLQPERSYKILIKTTLGSGEMIIIDRDIIFKVVR